MNFMMIIWEEKKNIRLPFLKNDALSSAFNYARFIKDMQVLTRFGMKISLILPNLDNKYFNSLIDENDEPI